MRLYGMRYFYQLLMKKRYFKMKFLYSLSLILFVSVNLFSEPIYNFQNAEDEIRFNTLVKEIRCPKCTSGSLASSNAPISQDLKLKIVNNSFLSHRKLFTTSKMKKSYSLLYKKYK